jgi:DNA-binding beta-propeller fold protein YncE
MKTGPVRLLLASAGIAFCSMVLAADPSPLVLETKIALGNVSGRIDHLAIDLSRQRLFVAELGNNSVGVVDLKERKLLRRITGLKEPQGLGYVASTDTLYVANAGDGSVQLFQGADLSPAGRIDLGDDADNIRIDARANKLYVGYGKGAIAIVDPVKRAKIGDVKLEAHPEGFQLDSTGTKIFVNVPSARQIAFVDLALGKVAKTFPMNDARSNFPMAIDHERGRILSVFRNPAKLIAVGTRDGSVLASVTICGDADDVFVDPKRHRVYVSCGEGFIDVFATSDSGYSRIGHVSTAAGARTSLLVPEIDRLFVAVRESGAGPPAIWVFRPE